jgi:DNA-binding transcriptional MerR regulator
MSELLLPEIPVEVPENGLSIGEASKATGVSIEALRYYERAGLLLEKAPRDTGGRRRYRKNDLAWIAGLVVLRETGMSIADMTVIADLSRRQGTEAERLAFYEKHRVHVVDEIARTRRHLAAIDRKIAAYRAQAAEGES